jgi:nucleotide-binding universal stress UspA family protein
VNDIKKKKGKEPNMFKKILYPTDFSDVSKKAVDYLVQLKEAGAKEIIILHVIDQKGMDAVYRYGAGSAVEIVGAIEKEARQEANKIEKKLRQSGLEVKIRIETGIPLKEILKVEEEEKVSVIVIGSHGKTNLEQMVLGSVSEKVIHQSKKPVLVIKR